MKAKLKPLDQQVIVITGGSSGIGLATARRAADMGSRLVLAARNEDALSKIKKDLEGLGGDVEYVTADVGQEADVRRIAATAVKRFGGFDTWINDAGAATYGKIVDTPVEDMRQVFETNFWGIVYGSLIAVEHLRTRPHGGKIINLGSVLSDFAVPEQGPYVASKHAVKGFTHTLRIEMRQMRLPISVSLIKPSGIDTPYKDHARNRMDAPARLPPVLYAPNIAADAILYACQHDVRDLTVGFNGRAQQLFQEYLPEWADTLFAAFGSELQKDRRPGHTIKRDGNLYTPEPDGAEASDHRFVRKTSLYTAAQTHPRTTAALALFGGLAAAGALINGRRA